MIFDAKLIKNILGIIGAVGLVLIVGVFFPSEAEKNENQRIFVNSAEIQGVSDEVIIDDDLEVNGYPENIDDEETKVLEQNNALYKVVKVIDGDTIVVDIGGKNETIRLIGIDAPEIGGGSRSKKCFGKEAEEFARKLLSDASVELKKDESQNDRDKYNRLLRYAIMEDGNNFNEQMISGGLAREYTYKTPYKYQKEFKNAENEARNEKKGLWGACTKSQINADERSDRSQNGPQIDAENLTNNCYCESNKYNCTDFKTHNEAQKIFECCIAKVGNDIHKLDGNNDGQVCESLP